MVSTAGDTNFRQFHIFINTQYTKMLYRHNKIDNLKNKINNLRIFCTNIYLYIFRKNLGMIESMVSVSLEKRFTRLPLGVRSKKDMGERSTLYSMDWWR